MVVQKARHLIIRNIQKISCVSKRHHNYDGEAVAKSNLAMIAQEDKNHTYIQAYSSYGFRLVSGFSIHGSCAIFPRAILHWNVKSADKITPESLSLFTLLEPKLDILVIGKGDWNASVDYNAIRFLRTHKLNFEILPTEQACSTFNFLNAERRVVAAALIPPKVLTSPMDEAHQKLMLDLAELDQIQSIEDLHDAEMAEVVKQINSGEFAQKRAKLDEVKSKLSEQNELDEDTKKDR
ncbi:NADH dehydrogenase [ubiquinone] 1 alpha subcomplex assembly factor 3-like isoform X1 [Biomphalaria glabrata]|uniref:NADH dehydrogenase [ubiquinone] 1 alpha subcomplex assembly factor 3 n=2 Tax=Biomphalaria glabrata TaxID=6526 RepID=A0A9W3A9J1_BIOGL|nr:NADH dehydrogenase [ubiquinone] 1 alpha subcomplex assembly factor 3-like isoform X1 [Biomphalaria glabrata]KAI8730965.1 dehydrogenase [ubiquinone] 1 alpha subcomplex assembly factor 3 [Biomphalaria glabrata]